MHTHYTCSAVGNNSTHSQQMCDFLWYRLFMQAVKHYKHCFHRSPTHSTIISCRQLNGTHFVLQIAGKFIFSSLGFQNFPRGHVPHPPPQLSKALWTLHFSARLWCPDARLLKKLYWTPAQANKKKLNFWRAAEYSWCHWLLLFLNRRFG